jgi:hypothetical protein
VGPRNLHRRFIAGKTHNGRIVNGSIGEFPDQDQAHPVLDPITRFGADTQYKPNVQVPYRVNPFARYPWTLSASNRVSEHNIFNAWPVIVVAQYAGPTEPPDYRRIVSRRIRLPQSMTGGA